MNFVSQRILSPATRGHRATGDTDTLVSGLAWFVKGIIKSHGYVMEAEPKLLAAVSCAARALEQRRQVVAAERGGDMAREAISIIPLHLLVRSVAYTA